jgi:hypothetical protein
MRRGREIPAGFGSSGKDPWRSGTQCRSSGDGSTDHRPPPGGKSIARGAKRPAGLRVEAIPEAIRKLERRLRNFREADPSKHADNLWSLAQGLCNKLSATVAEIFGVDSLEAERLDI